MIETLQPEGLKAAIIQGAEHLVKNHRILDRLNVFPVPDGDTGSNMVATLKAAVEDLKGRSALCIGDIANPMIEHLVRDSRGNSGFILAWFFTGFLKAAETYDRFDRAALIEAFAHGAYQVNTSLFTPVEGTMITIIAAMTGALRDSSSNCLYQNLSQAVAAGRASLFETPRMLPLLAKAGVVDSGALGFIFIIEGMLHSLAGGTQVAVPVVTMEEDEQAYRFAPDPAAFKDWNPVPEYRFCTEVYVARENGYDDPDLRPFLQERGNSIALVVDPAFIKLHIHTNDPQEILERLKPFGEIQKSKIEDMHEQVRLFSTEGGNESTCAILACVPGAGFGPLLEALGVACTLVHLRDLPTAGEILEQLSAMEASHIIILPNNGNILPAVITAKDMCGKEVAILPTRNIVQGMAAAYGYSENATLDENLQSMKACLGFAEGLSVYRSGVASVFGDVKIPSGHYFVLHNDLVLSIADDPVQAVLEAAAALNLKDKNNITMYTGSDFDDSLMPEIRAGLGELNPALAMEVYPGGQSREILIMAVE
ncbi:MAG: DAK2 domain-containing protein [Clostridia bacterium]|jgi:DAK2 domain fusion protein YloV